MTAVWFVAKPASLKLHRDPPGDVMDTEGGRFDLPPKRVLTLRSGYGWRRVSIQALDGPVKVGDVTIGAGEKIDVKLDDDHASVFVRAA